MIEREITCIGCPMGCELIVEIEDDKVIRVRGNSCNIGAVHGEKECLNPTRTITTTLPVIGGEYERLPVKTDREIPKGKIGECMLVMKDVEIMAPVQSGDILIENIAETGANIIATAGISRI